MKLIQAVPRCFGGKVAILVSRRDIHPAFKRWLRALNLVFPGKLFEGNKRMSQLRRLVVAGEPPQFEELKENPTMAKKGDTQVDCMDRTKPDMVVVEFGGVDQGVDRFIDLF